LKTGERGEQIIKKEGKKNQHDKRRKGFGRGGEAENRKTQGERSRKGDRVVGKAKRRGDQKISRKNKKKKEGGEYQKNPRHPPMGR